VDWRLHHIYLVDEDFGPLFIKFAGYFPYQAKVCLNGHEYVKRHARAGITFQAPDNGVLTCAGPPRLQAICDSLTPQKIDQSFASGCAACRIRLPPMIARPATGTPSRYCKWNAP
jgi:hypothetical protein